MITKEENEEIQARLEAARAAPWIVKDDNEDTEYLPFWVINNEPDESGDWFVELRVGDYPTADFIAHAPEDMRKLLDALGEAKSERSRLIECLEALGRKTQGDTICDICIHRNLSGKDEPCIDCLHPNKHFHLDEARIFTGGDGE